MSDNKLAVSRARVMARLDLVERDYEGFNVTEPGIKKETFRVYRDEEGCVRCSCPDYEKNAQEIPRYRCVHILAVKFHFEPPDGNLPAVAELSKDAAAWFAAAAWFLEHLSRKAEGIKSVATIEGCASCAANLERIRALETALRDLLNAVDTDDSVKKSWYPRERKAARKLLDGGKAQR